MGSPEVGLLGALLAAANRSDAPESCPSPPKNVGGS